MRRILLALSLLLISMPAVALNNNGTVTGAPTYGTGHFGQGMGTFSTANYVTLPSGSFPDTMSWTMEAWLQVPAGNATEGVAVQIGTATNPYYLGVTGAGNPVAAVDGTGGFAGGTTITCSAVINDGNFHHVVFQMSGGTTLTIWSDGTQCASATGSMYVTSATSAYIGFLQFAGAYVWPGQIDEVAFFDYAKYSGTSYTVPTAAYTGTEAGLTSLYHFDSNVNDSTVPVSIAPNDAGFLYSPSNWDISATQSQTINAGAYFSTMFKGNTVTLNFTTTNLTAPISELYITIDGYMVQSPWTLYNATATISPVVPQKTSQAPYHLLKVMVKSTSATINRWNSPSNVAVIFTGLTLPPGGALYTPTPAPNGQLVMYTDSVGEGVRTVNQTDANDTDQNDSLMAWTYQLGHLLGMETGIIGFGSAGYTVVGSGNVPALTGSYNYMMAGIARPINTAAKVVIIEDGANDYGTATATEQANILTVLNGVEGLYPNAVVVLLSLNGSFVAQLQAAALQATDPNRIQVVNAIGVLNTALSAGLGFDSLNLHPTGANDQGYFAPGIAALLKPYVNPPVYTYQ